MQRNLENFWLIGGAGRAIYGKRRVEGLKEDAAIKGSKNSNRWTPEEEGKLKQLVLANTPLPDIAIELGRTVAAVKARAYELRLALGHFGAARRRPSRWV